VEGEPQQTSKQQQNKISKQQQTQHNITPTPNKKHTRQDITHNTTQRNNTIQAQSKAETTVRGGAAAKPTLLLEWPVSYS
jgi:hypothetical protein